MQPQAACRSPGPSTPRYASRRGTGFATCLPCILDDGTPGRHRTSQRSVIGLVTLRPSKCDEAHSAPSPSTGLGQASSLKPQAPRSLHQYHLPAGREALIALGGGGHYPGDVDARGCQPAAMVFPVPDYLPIAR